MSSSTVAVIGAGPTGIAVLKELRRRGIDVVAFERGAAVAPRWTTSLDDYSSPAYDSLKLNNSSGRMRFVERPIRAKAHSYASSAEFYDYLKEIVASEHLASLIRLGIGVTSAVRHGGRWVLMQAQSELHRCEHLVIATGMNAKPNGLESITGFEGTVTHARDYYNASRFANKRVLIAGAGNSGADIASAVSYAASTTHISFPHPVHIVPRYVGRFACDRLDSPVLSRLPLKVRQFIHDAALAKFARRANAAGLVIPTQPLLQAAWTISSELVDRIAASAIAPRPWPAGCEGKRVIFDDGTSDVYDEVILATGYDPDFPVLPSRPQVSRTENRCYMKIVPVDDALPSTYFAGCVLPLGPLLPVVESQARWIAAVVSRRVRIPTIQKMSEAVQKQISIDRARFIATRNYSIVLDPYPYIRNLDSQVEKPTENRSWLRSYGLRGSIETDHLDFSDANRSSVTNM